MTDLKELNVYTTTDDQGRWYAATGVVPYFCFEGATEQEVLAEAADALKFYKQFAVKAAKHISFDTKHRVRASELAAA